MISKKVAALVLFLVVLTGLTGCAPELQVIGPVVDAPFFDDHRFHTADGVDLPVKVWPEWHGDKSRKPLGIILALHGFNDHIDGLDLPGSGLSRRGYRVYAYDQRGFGRTPQRGICLAANS